MAYRAGDAYAKRDDNPPELVTALSMWGFPADFDPTQLPTGMFSCVMDEWRDVKREKDGLPPIPRETLGDVWREQDAQAAREAARKKDKEPVKSAGLKSRLKKIFAIIWSK